MLYNTIDYVALDLWYLNLGCILMLAIPCIHLLRMILLYLAMLLYSQAVCALDITHFCRGIGIAM